LSEISQISLCQSYTTARSLLLAYVCKCRIFGDMKVLLKYKKT